MVNSVKITLYSRDNRIAEICEMQLTFTTQLDYTGQRSRNFSQTYNIANKFGSYELKNVLPKAELTEKLQNVIDLSYRVRLNRTRGRFTHSTILQIDFKTNK